MHWRNKVATEGTLLQPQTLNSKWCQSSYYIHLKIVNGNCEAGVGTEGIE